MASTPSPHRHLLDARSATSATGGRSGRLQLPVVRSLAEGDGVGTPLNGARQKAANLLANSACSLLIAGPANNCRYLGLRGRAEVVADDDHAFADGVGAEYGTDLTRYDGAEDIRYRVKVVPERAHAVNMGV